MKRNCIWTKFEVNCGIEYLLPGEDLRSIGLREAVRFGLADGGEDERWTGPAGKADERFRFGEEERVLEN